jgi:hypothetical protein
MSPTAWSTTANRGRHPSEAIDAGAGVLYRQRSIDPVDARDRALESDADHEIIVRSQSTLVL